MAEPDPPVPPPGSDAAVAAGCTCPVWDNRRGAGYLPGVYVIAAGCPVHGPANLDDVYGLARKGQSLRPENV